MTAALLPATLVYQDGVPYSPSYGDIYHTRSGGLAQSKAVFLAGNQLPMRWQNRECFTILETGFGLGLNFLSTWECWKNDPLACQRLHFISLEKHPFPAPELASALNAWPELAPLATELIENWPPLVPGFHRLRLNNGRIVLTLIFGDACQLLRKVEASVDAFYLDGFSPAKNPELWTPEIAKALGRLAAPKATLATWSVANSLQDALREAGFAIERVDGFGDKRYRLCGQFRHQKPVRYRPPETRTALVIGAGIAGSTVAERLASRGWQVTLIDAAERPGQGASGNLAGVLRPLPSADDNRLAQLTRAGFLAVRQHVLRLQQQSHYIRWDQCGVLHLAQDKEQAATQKKTIERLTPPIEYLRFMSADEASKALGYPIAHGGWFFPTGGWVQPPSICAANIAAHPQQIQTRFKQSVADLRQNQDGTWATVASDGQIIAQAQIAVMASGIGAPHFTHFKGFPQKAVRGQVSHLAANQLHHPLPHLVCGHGYIAPAVDGIHVLGASTVPDDLSDEIRASEHHENLSRLAELLPGCLANANVTADELGGRVGFRPASPDRLPIVGAMIDFGQPVTTRPKPIPGLWCIQGFGARGIVWSALMAELLACQIMAEPLNLPSDLVKAVSPNRLLNKTPGTADCDTMSQV